VLSNVPVNYDDYLKQNRIKYFDHSQKINIISAHPKTKRGIGLVATAAVIKYI